MSDNLIPQNKRTKNEQRKVATMGGLASGKSRKKTKELQDILRAFLKGKYKASNERLEEIVGNTDKLTLRETLLLVQILKAVDGDLQSYKYILQILGEDPEFLLRRELAKLSESNEGMKAILELTKVNLEMARNVQ